MKRKRVDAIQSLVMKRLIPYDLLPEVPEWLEEQLSKYNRYLCETEMKGYHLVFNDHNKIDRFIERHSYDKIVQNMIDNGEKYANGTRDYNEENKWDCGPGIGFDLYTKNHVFYKHY